MAARRGQISETLARLARGDPIEKLTSAQRGLSGPTILAGRLQAQLLGALCRGQVVGAADPDGEFGISHAAQRDRLDAPRFAAASRRGAAPDRRHSPPSTGPAFARLSTSASISVPGRPSRSRLAMCRVASATKERWLSNAVSESVGVEWNRSRGPASRSISSQTMPARQIDQQQSSPVHARAPRRRQNQAKLLARSDGRRRPRSAHLVDHDRAYRSRPMQHLAASISGSPMMPARCRTSGSSLGIIGRATNDRDAFGAERRHDGIEAGRHDQRPRCSRDAECTEFSMPTRSSSVPRSTIDLALSCNATPVRPWIESRT